MRYPALRVIVVVHYVLALVVLCVAWVAILGPAEAYVKGGIVLGGVAAIVLLVGFAELLRVIMDIEENTRTGVLWSANAAQRAQPQVDTPSTSPAAAPPPLA